MASAASGSSNLVVGILTIAVIIAVVILWAKYSNKKTRSQTWTGTVTDKKQSSSIDDDGDRTYYYTLIVAADGAAKPKKVKVSGALFATFNIGDKIEKKLGELQPSKVA